VVSSRGTSYEWKGYDDFVFQAYCLKGLSKNKVALIKEHIISKSLFLSDLNRTQLRRLLPDADKETELSEIFVDFLQLPDEKIEALYCYKNPDTGKIYVSDTPEGISDVLNDQYPVETLWEDLSDEELEAYLEEYGDGECEIPFSYFD
ncbi:MAG: hypothetical protein J5865_01725, partial [Lachnospiraceae bacterium]|nr:hypothetical protein [Lachnospiraceae bacterium]